MTVVVTFVDPPRDGLVLPALPDETPLTPSEATRLYEATVKDLLVAGAASGGDLLVNYRTEDDIPNEFTRGVDVEAELQGLAADALNGIGNVRFEPQVGSTRSARVGNTVTHLLDQDDVDTVTVCDPLAPTRSRSDIDSIAMKLRRTPVVLGPGGRGRVHTAAFSDPIDFDAAYTPPELTTITQRARDAGHDVDYSARHALLGTHDDLLDLHTEIAARRAADRAVPHHTAAVLADLDLHVDTSGDEPRLSRN